MYVDDGRNGRSSCWLQGGSPWLQLTVEITEAPISSRILAVKPSFWFSGEATVSPGISNYDERHLTPYFSSAERGFGP